MVSVVCVQREMNGLLYTPGQELAVLQKLQMVVSVEPKLLARADLLSVLQRILVRALSHVPSQANSSPNSPGDKTSTKKYRLIVRMGVVCAGEDGGPRDGAGGHRVRE